MVVTKKLCVRLGRSATSQQVLKMKIDGAPGKSEAPLESAVWQATSRKKPEKWRTPSCFARCQKNKPASYFAVKVALPPKNAFGPRSRLPTWTRYPLSRATYPKWLVSKGR